MRKSVLLLALLLCLGSSALGQDDPMAAREAPDIENPKTARDYYSRGWKHQKAGQYDEALADYRVAGELDPMFFDAHFFQSSLLAERRDYRGAIAALTASLKARPKSFVALFNRGLYHEYLREIDDAIADYTQAAAEDANFSYMGGTPEENRARAYHYRGRAYQWFKKDDVSAVADFTAALELDPEILRVRRRRALAYHSLGEYAKAFEDLKRALEQDPSDSTASGRLSHWGWELVESPEPQYRDGELALLLAQKTKTDRNSLAAAQAKAGQFENAVATQQRALDRLDLLIRWLKLPPKPDFEEAIQGITELRADMQRRLDTYRHNRLFQD